MENKSDKYNSMLDEAHVICAKQEAELDVLIVKIRVVYFIDRPKITFYINVLNELFKQNLL